MMKKVQLLITLFVMLAQYAFAQGEPATLAPHFQLNFHGNGLGLAYVF